MQKFRMRRTQGTEANHATAVPPPAPFFRLVRYFTVASLAAFAVVMASLIYLERVGGNFFHQVLREQSLYFKQVQDGFAKQDDETARRDLLTVYEAGNVNLTRLFANVLWEKDFAPFVAKAQRIPVDRCRAIADVKDAGGKSAQPAEKKTCYAGIGKQIMTFPEFRALEAKVFDTMKKSIVFKIKVYDVRGITVYSSEHGQIGEDKTGNDGWESAVAGKPASQLTHRNKFNAFESVVENRDLIESYIPVRASGSEKIVGVFEIYSDVTPFLEQIRNTSAQIQKVNAENQAQVERAVAANEAKADSNEYLLIAVVLGVLVLLYCALFLIVRNGQRIMDRERVELERAEERFRGLVEQSIAGIYIIQDGKFVYVNSRAAEILGQGAVDDLIGTDPLLWIAEVDRGVVAENMRRLLEGEATSVALEFGALRRDGVTIQVGANAARATNEDRPAIIGLMQDISEKKRDEEQIRRHVAQLKIAFMSTVEVATILSEMRDPYTAGHARRVAEIAVAISAELGFDAQRQEGLRVAGLLHDVGKITIPAEILTKPGKLSAVEFELIQGHARASYDILKNVEFPWPVAEIALQHHERMDGSGYPQGLKGEAILLEAKILAVADVVEAMSSNRPYRPGLGIEEALTEIEDARGTLYDVDAADACLRLFREKGHSLPV